MSELRDESWPAELPRRLELGCACANRVNAFQLKLRVTEPLALTCSIRGLSLSPERLSIGENTLTLRLESMPAGLLLAGELVAQGSGEWHIPLLGRVVDDLSAFAARRLIYDWQQPGPEPKPLPVYLPLPPEPAVLPAPLKRGQRLSLADFGPQLWLAVQGEACWLPLDAADRPLSQSLLWQPWQRPGLSWQIAAPYSALCCTLSQIEPSLCRLLLLVTAGPIRLRIGSGWQDRFSFCRTEAADIGLLTLAELYRHQNAWKLALLDDSTGLDAAALAERYGISAR